MENDEYASLGPATRRMLGGEHAETSERPVDIDPDQLKVPLEQMRSHQNLSAGVLGGFVGATIGGVVARFEN